MVLTKSIPNAPKDTRSLKLKKEHEYGTLTSSKYLLLSQHPINKPLKAPEELKPSLLVYTLTLINFLIYIVIGHIRDFFGKIFKPHEYEDLIEVDGYAPWYDGFESFFVRRLKTRIDDLFARPIHGVPGRYISCFNRIRYGKYGYLYNGTSKECLNLSSYNYLGFAQSSGSCTSFALDCLRDYGVSGCNPRLYSGTDLHKKCESVIAQFVGKDDSIIVSQGYGTNANFFMSIADSKTLIISDELNHASIRFGIRLSGAIVKVFKHNDMKSLEKLIRNEIAQGRPKSHRAWGKIIIAVEGLYSMEGTICNLPELIRIKEKYKCYLFIDEAHSIGAIGPNGKGICDYFGVDPSKVDILMGTLTKSFGATGGYIAGSKQLINKLRLDYITQGYAESVPPPVLGQIISSLSIIKGDLNPSEGKERLQRIAFNSRYLRSALKRLGFIVYGADDSPVIPLLIFLPTKMPILSRTLYELGIAVVVVSYPATPLLSARVRLCLSSALTKEDIDDFLVKMNNLGDTYTLKYNPIKESIEDVLANNTEYCKNR
ncbi:unnamed protein product [Candida verbasci]|uniref:Aminotransferase class I/classII large domain-containing protein n=1 Tax=Candida verbasci TaxID=1227364 RepID=A0A9W4XCG0_9ASCO|nr:unnamed protein product [Candida verbasci]